MSCDIVSLDNVSGMIGIVDDEIKVMQKTTAMTPELQKWAPLISITAGDETNMFYANPKDAPLVPGEPALGTAADDSMKSEGATGQKPMDVYLIVRSLKNREGFQKVNVNVGVVE
jgi:hypothetical protein